MKIPQLLLNLIFIAIIYSVIQSLLVQKIKELPFIKKGLKTWMVNFVLSFAIGICFSMFFFSLSIYCALWVALFSFIGASAIYEGIIKIKK